MLNKLSDKINQDNPHYDSYSNRLCKNPHIVKDLLFIEVALSDPSSLFAIFTHNNLMLPNEWIKKTFIILNNSYSNFNIGLLSSVKPEDLTDQLINKLRVQEELIKKYENPDYNWTGQEIEKWKSNNGFSFSKLSASKGKFWTKELIDKYKERWSWYELSINPELPWDDEFIDMYKDEWNWDNISKNRGINWTTSLIDKFFSLLNLSHLVKNENFPWTVELVMKHKDALRINDSEIETIWKVINANKNFKWIDKINDLRSTDYRKLEKNAGIFSQLNGTNGSNISVECLRFEMAKTKPFIRGRNFDLNQEMPWCDEILNYLTKDIESKHMVNTAALQQTISYWYHVDNTSIPWSLEILEEYEYFWDWDKIIESEKIWNAIFKDVLTEELVLSIIKEFNKKENFYEYTYNFSQKPVYYRNHHTLNYGKYEGEEIVEILNKDPEYINILIESSGPFYLTTKDLREFEKNNRYKFSEKAYKMASKKMLHSDKEDLESYYEEMQNY